jgi:hypothetical protein
LDVQQQLQRNENILNTMSTELKEAHTSLELALFKGRQHLQAIEMADKRTRETCIERERRKIDDRRSLFVVVVVP